MTTIANAQDSKTHLRDFTSQFVVDTLTVKGNSSFVKRRVITIQKTEGIKSAFWDDANNILTVQYNSKLIGLSDIKNFFVFEQSIVPTQLENFKR
jgi:hypothetical protein